MSQMRNNVQEQQRALLDAIASMDLGDSAATAKREANYGMVRDLVWQMAGPIPMIAESRKRLVRRHPFLKWMYQDPMPLPRVPSCLIGLPIPKNEREE